MNELLPKVHQHILDELRVNTKTDTVFVIMSIIINTVILSVNSVIAGDWSPQGAAGPFVVMLLFAILLIVVNTVVLFGLVRGRKTRTKLISGLIRMYEEHGVSEYYDKSILESYKTRYNLFMLVTLATGLVALLVPLVTLGY